MNYELYFFSYFAASSNVNIYNGLQSLNGGFSIRVWIHVSSDFVKAQLGASPKTCVSQTQQSLDADSFAHLFHIYSRVPEAYDINEVSLLKVCSKFHESFSLPYFNKTFRILCSASISRI